MPARAPVLRRRTIAAVVALLLAAACGRAPARIAVVSPPARVESPPCTPAPLADRAARVLLVGLPEVTSPSDPLVDEVLELGVGGILLTDGNVESARQVRSLVHFLRFAARHPLVISADEEPGRVRTFADLFGQDRSARRMAAEGSVDDVEEAGRVTGQRLASLGLDLDLAPVADVDGGPSGGIIGDRSFSANPFDASRFSLAYARGLAQAGVNPTVKHFPGHGRASDDSHVRLPEVPIPLTVLASTDLVPFIDAVAAGVPVVMMGHVAYDALDAGVPASMSPSAYRLLRRLGFDGVALTDSIGMGAVNLRWDFPEAAVRALVAGADGVVATDGRQAGRMRDAILHAVDTGRLNRGRLDQAAARMTALAGGDPEQFSCTPGQLPSLQTSRPAPGFSGSPASKR